MRIGLLRYICYKESNKLMSTQDYIEHNGVINSIDNQHITVMIVSESACASCHAKSACTAADMQDKLIDIYQESTDFKVGQQVILMGRKTMGTKAVILAYLIPLVLIFITLISSFQLTDNETLSGILSLVILIPYFTAIYFFKDKLQHTFSFTIKQLN